MEPPPTFSNGLFLLLEGEDDPTTGSGGGQHNLTDRAIQEGDSVANWTLYAG